MIDRGTTAVQELRGDLKKSIESVIGAAEAECDAMGEVKTVTNFMYVFPGAADIIDRKYLLVKPELFDGLLRTA